jgi:hypothetical protein
LYNAVVFAIFIKNRITVDNEFCRRGIWVEYFVNTVVDDSSIEQKFWGEKHSKTKQPYKKSSWKWFAVKPLLEGAITGEPSPETIDKNYTSDLKSFEESMSQPNRVGHRISPRSLIGHERLPVRLSHVASANR